MVSHNDTCLRAVASAVDALKYIARYQYKCPGRSSPQQPSSQLIQHFEGSRRISFGALTRQREILGRCGQPLVFTGQNSLIPSAKAFKALCPSSLAPRKRTGRGAAVGKNPSKESEAVEQLAFREKNLRDRPPLFRRACLPIPIAPWFRRKP